MAESEFPIKALVAGSFCAAIVFITATIFLDVAASYRGDPGAFDMDPRMAFIGLPLIWAFYLSVSYIFERVLFIFRRFDDASHMFAAALSYALLPLAASGELVILVIIAIVNPVTVHMAFAVRRTFRG